MLTLSLSSMELTCRRFPASFHTCKPVANAVGGADQRDLIDQGIGHGFDCLCLAASEEGILDADCMGFVAEALCVVVVEIFLARTHAAHIERQVLLDWQSCLLDVVAHGYWYEWTNVVCCQAPPIAGLGEAGIEVRLEQLEALRVHEYRNHAIRYLGGIADARRRYARRIDLHPLIAVQDERTPKLAAALKAARKIRDEALTRPRPGRIQS